MERTNLVDVYLTPFYSFYFPSDLSISIISLSFLMFFNDEVWWGHVSGEVQDIMAV